METDILLKEVLGYAHFPEENVFNIIIKYYGANKLKKAIKNAEKTAQQFAENSNSKLDKIISADQGQFSIDNRDENTQYIKKVRVVTTVTYSLKD